MASLYIIENAPHLKQLFIMCVKWRNDVIIISFDHIIRDRILFISVRLFTIVM